MLDAKIRPFIEPPLNQIGRWLAACNIKANQVTLFGLFVGILACFTVATSNYTYAVIFLILNRLCDGLDGAIAREKGLSDFGGFLDICCDFIVYTGIIFAFAIADPENALYAAFLIFSFIGTISTFLTYAIIAEKRGRTSYLQNDKSFYYLSGICEGTETFAILLLMCFVPSIFAILCILYGLLCWATTIAQIMQAQKDFS